MTASERSPMWVRRQIHEVAPLVDLVRLGRWAEARRTLRGGAVRLDDLVRELRAAQGSEVTIVHVERGIALFRAALQTRAITPAQRAAAGVGDDGGHDEVYRLGALAYMVARGSAGGLGRIFRGAPACVPEQRTLDDLVALRAEAPGLVDESLTLEQAEIAVGSRTADGCLYQRYLGTARDGAAWALPDAPVPPLRASGGRRGYGASRAGGVA